MRPLYEINQDYERLLYEIEVFAQENGGEIPPDLGEKLDMVERERLDKVRSYGLIIKNFRAEAEMVDGEVKRLQSRKKHAERVADHLSLVLSEILQGEKYKDASLSIGWRASEACIIPDESLVPDQYVEYERKIKVREIKADLKACAENPEALNKLKFAFLEKKNNIQIR